MKLLRRVLLSLNLPQQDAAAMHTARHLAEAFDSEVQLLHVVEGYFDPPRRREEVIEEREREVELLKRQLEADRVRVGFTAVVTGDPSEQIAHWAGRLQVNVIIIGSGNTVARSLIDRTGTPVWVARSSEQPGRIVCGLDFGPAAGRVLRNAARLSRRLAASLWLVPLVCYREDDDQHTAQENARAQLAELLEREELADLTCFVIPREGWLAEQVCRVAEQVEADLLVFSACSERGILRYFQRDPLKHVVRSAPCSLLVVHGEDAVRLEVDWTPCALREELDRGQALLAEGFARESMMAFDRCLSRSVSFPPAWEGMAEAHRRLGQLAEAERCRQVAELIRQYSRDSPPAHDWTGDVAQ